MRDIDSGTNAALKAQHVPALMLAELDFPDGFVRLNNSGQNMVWNGNTFYGQGSLVSISAAEEAASLEAKGITLQLSAITLAPIPGSPDGLNIIQVARAQRYQGRNATVWLAPLDPDTFAPLIDPCVLFSGRMNKMDFQVADTATFSLACEARTADWNKPRMRRYNDADQRARFPGDRGLEFMEQNVEKNLVWGFPIPTSTAVQPTNPLVQAGYGSGNTTIVLAGYGNGGTGNTRIVQAGYGSAPGRLP